MILLLVSSDFIASDYCYDVEMKKAMELHSRKKARVIPVIMRPCDWHSAPFGKLEALPRDAKAITTWSNRDEGFLDVAKGIRKVAEEIQIQSAEDSVQPPNDLPTEELAARDIVGSKSAKSVPCKAAEYTFSGTGPSTTSSFTIVTSPWKLRYKVNWSGHFVVQVRGRRIELVVNRGVTAGSVYDTYVHGQVGNLHFMIQEAPPDGDWTLLVITGEK